MRAARLIELLFFKLIIVPRMRSLALLRCARTKAARHH
jgi:hypothetical protein